METEGELGLETGVKLGYLHTCQELPVLQLAKLIPELQGLYIHPMGTTQSIKNEKPDFLTIMQGKWMSPWKIELTSQEMETLSPELQAATRSIQEKIGRRNVAYPMPVGTHSVTESKKWRPRPTDVIILTFHKTGTTWMQQITHQLRTKGYGTDFPEITAVMPWIDFAWEINQNLQDDQVAEPRLFKSHARLSAIQEGCKYIVTIRDPIKTLISLFRFFTAKFPDPPFPKQWLENIDNFARCPLWAIDSIWGGNYWDYMAEFWVCRDEENVLLVPFEVLKEDLEKEIPRIANFMGKEIPMDQEEVSRVANLSSLKYMSEHEVQFNEGWFYEEQLKYKRYDAPPLPPVAKVNATTAQVSPTAETQAWMQGKWAEIVAPKTGFSSYADMLATWKKENIDGSGKA